jgi:hypothetical protein
MASPGSDDLTDAQWEILARISILDFRIGPIIHLNRTLWAVRPRIAASHAPKGPRRGQFCSFREPRGQQSNCGPFG